MKQTKQILNQATGSIYIIVSALFYASYGIWSKLMAGFFGEFNQAWIRALILVLVLTGYGLAASKFQADKSKTSHFKPIKKQDLPWFIVISLCGGLNQAPYFFGMEHLPVGTAVLLFYLMLTIGAYLIGKIFFNEKITPVKLTSLFLALIGLLIIYRFSLTASQLLPAGLMSLAGLMGAGVVVFSKKISSSYSETQILTSVFATMFLINLPLSLLLGETIPSLTAATAWLGQAGYTSAMLIANAAVVAGFKHLDPSVGGVLGLLEVVFAAMFGIMFFGETMTASLAVGSLLIIIAAGLSDVVGLWKKYAKRHPNTKKHPKNANLG